MKHIPSFGNFINEEHRHKSVNHIEDDEPKEEKDDEVEKDVKSYMNKNKDNCPRCGEKLDKCKCNSKDPWSTQNYHRTPKGNVE